MAEKFISRGFKGRARETVTAIKERIPPGQYQTNEFPVLSAGPTPRTSLERWDFSIYGEIAEDLKWTWDEFRKLPRETVTCDIHCVTKWSKLNTVWTGVSVDTLLKSVDLEAQQAIRYLIAFCDGGYTTNLPLADIRGGKAWVVDEYDGRPLAPEHGGPARLLVPHLYFWKSAKWVRGFKLVSEDRAGFWESAGYHNYGDPVPLMAMIRHRAKSNNTVPTKLLYSSRSYDDVIYREELDHISANDSSLCVIHTLTRRQPENWTSYGRRIDRAMLAEIAWPTAKKPLAFTCGPTAAVEAVATYLLELGYEPERIKTERFGPTGG